jgi:ribosomal protein L34E
MFGKSNPATLVTIPRLIGKYKQVRVTFIDTPFFKTAGETAVKHTDDQFGLFILDEIFSRQSILSKLKGLLKKTHHCRKCDADLMGLKAHRRKFMLKLKYKDLPEFQLEIQMPAIPCRKCGTANVVNEDSTQYVISGAIALAFKSLQDGKAAMTAKARKP